MRSGGAWGGSLRGRHLLDDLRDDLSDLEDLVATNEGDIADLQGRIGALEGDFASLNADLTQLRLDHNADMDVINDAIADAVARIAALETGLEDLIDALNLRLAAIEGDVGDNALAIDAMLLGLTTTTAKAMANMMAINNLQDQVDDMLALVHWIVSS